MIYHQWTLGDRIYFIPFDYYEKSHTQTDSVVRTRKWTMQNFNTQVKK